MKQELHNDQTAPLEPNEFEKSILNKRVLIIGSGIDIDGRRLQRTIDGNRFDIVCRVNKHYGEEKDAGTRTDCIVTRWAQWYQGGQDFFPQELIDGAKQIVVLNQHCGFSETEQQIIASEIGVEKASAGVQAVAYFLNRGAREIWLLGFGYYQDGFHNGKRYCKNSKNYPAGMQDKNPFYDWNKERAFLLQQAQIKFL